MFWQLVDQTPELPARQGLGCLPCHLPLIICPRVRVLMLVAVLVVVEWGGFEGAAEPSLMFPCTAVFYLMEKYALCLS